MGVNNIRTARRRTMDITSEELSILINHQLRAVSRELYETAQNHDPDARRDAPVWDDEELVNVLRIIDDAQLWLSRMLEALDEDGEVQGG
jgi:hypothetical protein